MCQDNCTIENRKGKHIIWEERVLIEHLYNIQKKKHTEIAKELGRNRTTIVRELRLGMVELETTQVKTKIQYCAEVAQREHDLNATAKGPVLRIANDHNMAKYIENEIMNNKSPEVIANNIQKDEKYKNKIHWKTIYNYIDKNILNVTREDLVYGKYKKNNTTKKKENVIRAYKKEGKRIIDRPKEVENREILGHWEMDLVEGSKGMKEPYLLVLSERKSRKEIIRLLPDKTQQSVIKTLDKLERDLGVKVFRKTFKTITTDNGSEFLDWKGIEKSYTNCKKKRTIQYYADAYSSWQRGTNENINKMIRRFLPKGKSFKDLTKEEVQKIENWINNYPRKMFNFMTSKEVYENEFKIA